MKVAYLLIRFKKTKFFRQSTNNNYGYGVRSKTRTLLTERKILAYLRIQKNKNSKIVPITPFDSILQSKVFKSFDIMDVCITRSYFSWNKTTNESVLLLPFQTNV